MLARERQNIILSEIREAGSIRMSDIMERFQVSHETARRDLDALQDRNLLKRVYGGAVLPDEPPAFAEPAIGEEEEFATDERSAIAKSAAAMVRDGDTVFLSVGLTVQQIARELRGRKNLTVLTNSVLVMNELMNTHVRLYVLGGFVNSSEESIEGNLAIDTLSNFFVDIAFIGAGGISKELGVSDYSLDVAKLNRVILSRSDKTIVAAHSKKFGRKCLSVTCPVEEVSSIVTDSGLSPDFREHFKEKDVNLTIVEL